MRYRYLLVAVLVAVAAVACGRLQLGDKNKRREMDAVLRQTLQSSTRPAFVTRDAEGARLWKQTQQFYQRVKYEPAWMRDATPRARITAFTKALREADNEGLDPELYGVSTLEAKVREGSEGFLTKKGFEPKEAAMLDVWLTYLYMRHASDLADGLSDLAHADPAWRIKPENLDALAHFDKAQRENRIVESLLELTPDSPEYRAMRQTLSDYRAQAAKGGWPRVPADLKLKRGQRSPHTRALAARLAASGDFTGTVPDGTEPLPYDSALQEAVKRFQRRHGLQDDAVVSPAVAAEMNVPIEQRIAQLSMNMERWRWLPRNLGDRYILVNLPEQRLDVWENGKVVLSMRVIVGKPESPTPIFNDEMTHIVFSPYWNIPPGIARDETLPSLMRDPGFLARNNMEVVNKAGRTIDPSSINWMDPSSFRVRQRPGSNNALGLVKFMFPNQFDVYLHDTPTDSLFGRAARLFSHGCVRVEKPEELATYLLRDQPEWTIERIRAAMRAGSERHVKLKTPVPVYLGYWTASVSPDGLAQFRKDIYGIDGRLSAMIDDRLRRLHASNTAMEKPNTKN
jgi:murein L,D-transpeptidase YcbB/YkuD